MAVLIIVGLGLLVYALLVWAACKMAGDADRYLEDQREDLIRYRNTNPAGNPSLTYPPRRDSEAP